MAKNTNISEQTTYTALQTILNWFKTGKRPTQQQFWDTWLSFWHKSEPIPIDKIDGIQNVYDAVNKCAIDADVVHINGTETIRGLKIFDQIVLSDFLKFSDGDENVTGQLVFDGESYSFLAGNSYLFGFGATGFATFNQLNKKCYFRSDLVTQDRTYVLPNKSGVLAIEKPYKIFTAIISQTGVNNPVIIAELENDFGVNPFIFNRIANGSYRVSSNGIFIINKTTVSIDLNRLDSVANYILPFENDNFSFSTRLINNLSLSDNLILKSKIEIKVYN